MTSIVQRSEVGEFRRRYRWMVLLVIVTFLALIGRLVQLQLVEGDRHRAAARRNIIGERGLATTRGVIRDAFGRVLAANRPSYDVQVVPAFIDMEKTWPRVVRLMGIGAAEAAQLRQTILDARARSESRARQQTLLKVDVERDVVAKLETLAAELPGVEVAPSPVRYFPYGELGAHFIGYMREIDPDTLARTGDLGY
ncbi:MAG TPA: penicillin-binding protein 2, partial [Polyangiaceae bacterium]